MERKPAAGALWSGGERRDIAILNCCNRSYEAVVLSGKQATDAETGFFPRCLRAWRRSNLWGCLRRWPIGIGRATGPGAIIRPPAFQPTRAGSAGALAEDAGRTVHSLVLNPSRVHARHARRRGDRHPELFRRTLRQPARGYFRIGRAARGERVALALYFAAAGGRRRPRRQPHRAGRPGADQTGRRQLFLWRCTGAAPFQRADAPGPDHDHRRPPPAAARARSLRCSRVCMRRSRGRSPSMARPLPNTPAKPSAAAWPLCVRIPSCSIFRCMKTLH